MSSTSRKRNVVVWTVQGLLAALFLFAGTMKFFVPAEMLSGPAHLPIAFMLFIGCAEIAGAFGLVLPGVTHIRQELTPIAALGLVIIMIGATIITATSMGVPQSIGPFVVGLLAVFVARARWQSIRVAQSMTSSL
jgi:uncharacterized membrane protein YphA (DoxX/SURF4 family)